jgi:hypothetical protein
MLIHSLYFKVLHGLNPPPSIVYAPIKGSKVPSNEDQTLKGLEALPMVDQTGQQFNGSIVEFYLMTFLYRITPSAINKNGIARTNLYRSHQK